MELIFNDTANVGDSLGGDSVPYAALISPLDGATGVRPDVPIVLELVDGLRSSPSWLSIQIIVEGVLVWNNGAVQNGWSADVDFLPGITRFTLSHKEFTYKEVIDIQTSFDYGATRVFADTSIALDEITIDTGLVIVVPPHPPGF